MISGLNPANEQFLASLNTLQDNLSKANEQLSSGLRVNQASDAPQQLQDIFQTRADLGQAQQSIHNLTTAQSQLNAADTGVQSAIQLLTQAISLGTQGASNITSSSTLSTLSAEVQGIQSQLVAISRTEVGGVFIFSGDATGSPPYQVDSASPTGVDRLITPQQSTLKIADPAGVTFQISMTAQDLFDQRDASNSPTPQNAFAALNSLSQALQSGNPGAIAQAITSVQNANSYLNQQLGFYGSAENHITSALDLAQKFQTQDQTQLSNLQDADTASLAVQVTQASTALNAAMSAQAHKPKTTLFDYLPIA
jgi:flagellar hook-associated protein 3 FlgL